MAQMLNAGFTTPTDGPFGVYVTGTRLLWRG